MAALATQSVVVRWELFLPAGPPGHGCEALVVVLEVAAHHISQFSVIPPESRVAPVLTLFFQEDQLRGVADLFGADVGFRQLLAEQACQANPSGARAAIEVSLVAAGLPALLGIQADGLDQGEKGVLVVFFEGEERNLAPLGARLKERLEVSPEIKDIATPTDFSSGFFFAF